MSIAALEELVEGVSPATHLLSLPRGRIEIIDVATGEMVAWAMHLGSSGWGVWASGSPSVAVASKAAAARCLYTACLAAGMRACDCEVEGCALCFPGAEEVAP